MPKSIHRLSAASLKKLQQPGAYSDGNGLYLQVKHNGPSISQSWIFRYMRGGRARVMGLGSVKVISLAEARQAASNAQKLLHEGVDPLDARRSQTHRRNTPTFKVAAAKYIDTQKQAWKNAKHASQWTNTLRDYAEPVIGSLRIDAVGRQHILEILEPIWLEKPETASRVRGRIERILDWAKAEGYREGENPARWRGDLEYSLPKLSQARQVRHHPALPWPQVPSFYEDLSKQEGTAAEALRFTILTAARTSEVRLAGRDEFDFEAAIPLWTIPASRMKAGREHRVPLAPLVVDLVGNQPSDDAYCFAIGPNTPLSQTGMLALLKSMGRLDITVHGFRSSFRDWCAENTAYPREIAETALAHVNRDRVEAAYLRGDMLKKRYELMQAWATFVTTPPQRN